MSSELCFSRHQGEIQDDSLQMGWKEMELS